MVTHNNCNTLDGGKVLRVKEFDIESHSDTIP